MTKIFLVIFLLLASGVNAAVIDVRDSDKNSVIVNFDSEGDDIANFQMTFKPSPSDIKYIGQEERVLAWYQPSGIVLVYNNKPFTKLKDGDFLEVFFDVDYGDLEIEISNIISATPQAEFGDTNKKDNAKISIRFTSERITNLVDFIVQGMTSDPSEFDVNNDGQVNLTDLQIMVNYQ